MRNKNKFLIVASLLLAACTTEPLSQIVDSTLSTDLSVETKICNSSDDALAGALIVKFNEDAVEVVEKAAAMSDTRSATTRSGIESVDEILSDLNILSLERVFPEAGEQEEQTRKAGLHRWYLLRFDADQEIEQAAERLAAVAEVSTIQYSTERQKSFDGEAYPFTEQAAPQSRTMIRSDFNDPNLFWQWHYINNADQAIATTSRVGADINAAEAWKLTGGDRRVIVAVVDEGVKYTHPDLAANMWTNPSPSAQYDYKDIHGWNFNENCPVSWAKSSADKGHGTHVAGTVAAVNNNGIGVAGVAGGTGNNDGVRIMSCQIFSGNNATSDVSASRAIKYAADHGASILQCSYGYAGAVYTSERAYEKAAPMEAEAIRYFVSRNNCQAIDGGLAIFASGNEGMPYSNYPGGYRECIAVTAVSPDGLPAYYTCYGLGCNIAAPGGETVGLSGGERAGVLSTLCSEVNGTDYGYMQGTSMACPHVSGVAALGLSYALSKGKHFTRDEFTSMLLTSVNEIDSRFEGTKSSGATMKLEKYVGKMGTGLIDAYQLLMQIEGTPCLKVTTDKLALITLTQHFGGSAQSLTYTDVIVSDEDAAKLGMSVKPQIYNGQLMLKCTKAGVAHITVKAIAGGSRPSGAIMGGMEISKTFAIVARQAGADNGGWL